LTDNCTHSRKNNPPISRQFDCSLIKFWKPFWDNPVSSHTTDLSNHRDVHRLWARSPLEPQQRFSSSLRRWENFSPPSSTAKFSPRGIKIRAVFSRMLSIPRFWYRNDSKLMHISLLSLQICQVPFGNIWKLQKYVQTS